MPPYHIFPSEDVRSVTPIDRSAGLHIQCSQRLRGDVKSNTPAEIDLSLAPVRKAQTGAPAISHFRKMALNNLPIILSILIQVTEILGTIV